MSSLFHSLRWRVQAWHGLILFAVIVAFCLTAYRLAWENQLRSVDRNLKQTERTLMRGLISTAFPTSTPGAPDEKNPPSPGRLMELLRGHQLHLPAGLAPLFRGTDPGFAYFSLCDADGKVLLASPNIPPDLRYLPVTPGDFGEELRLLPNRRESLHSGPDGFRTLIGLDLTPENDELRRLAWSLAAAGLAVWLLGLVGGWWLSGRAIQPIRNISRTATHIADGNLGERIDTTGGDSELDQLGHVLNGTFDRLQAAFARQKQFTADASHELRTPVTVLLAETQRILKRERTPEEYRAAITTLQDTASRMRQLTESLLLLARQEAAGESPLRKPCDLGAILRSTAIELQPLAEARDLRFELDAGAAPCLGDASALSILATNLVANALQHHDGTGGVIHLASARRDAFVSLTVSDDGPGIPGESLPHLFERFYRVDRARTRGSGHAGLGLAIAQTIAANHGGAITAANNPDRGARFTLTLPAAPAA